MPVQLPTLTLQQQQDILKAIQTNAFSPVTFIINRTMTNGNFPSAGGGGRYVTLSYVPTQTVGLAAIGVNIFQIAASTIYNEIIQVSYASTINLSDSTTPALPNDTGNVIYTANFGNFNSNGFAKFYPGDYYIQTGNTLYLHFWVETAGIGSGNTFVGAVTLHTVPTGRQS